MQTHHLQAHPLSHSSFTMLLSTLGNGSTVPVQRLRLFRECEAEATDRRRLVLGVTFLAQLCARRGAAVPPLARLNVAAGASFGRVATLVCFLLWHALHMMLEASANRAYQRELEVFLHTPHLWSESQGTVLYSGACLGATSALGFPMVFVDSLSGLHRDVVLMTAVRRKDLSAKRAGDCSQSQH